MHCIFFCNIPWIALGSGTNQLAFSWEEIRKLRPLNASWSKLDGTFYRNKQRAGLRTSLSRHNVFVLLCWFWPRHDCDFMWEKKSSTNHLSSFASRLSMGSLAGAYTRDTQCIEETFNLLLWPPVIVSFNVCFQCVWTTLLATTAA